MAKLLSQTLILPPLQDKKIGSWRFAAGRIRSLETQLMGRNGLDRLYAAEGRDEIRLLMSEHHYPQGEFEDALRSERIAAYDLLREVAPEDGYRVALLLFNDLYNLKFMLKTRLKNQGDSSFSDLAHLTLQPSLIDPHQLFDLIAFGRDEGDCPDWIAVLIEEAEAAYSKTYEAVAIDRVLDRKAHEMAELLAEKLDNDWFCRYLAMQRDLINLETLLRSRYRCVSETMYHESLLPSGLISEEVWQDLFEAEYDTIVDLLNSSPYSSLSSFVDAYGISANASAFSSGRDKILIGHIEKGHHVLSGPELVLSYVLAREYEIKNLRIADAAIRNHLSREQKNMLRRDLW